MLVVIDGGLGPDATFIRHRLADAFGTRLAAVIAPTEPPDTGLLAALKQSTKLVLTGASPSPWLETLEAQQLSLAPPFDRPTLIDDLRAAFKLEPFVVPARRTPLLAPLDEDTLADEFAALDDRWRIEITKAETSLGGFRVSLVADIRCESYAATANLAHACANLAEEQDHHPTLEHDYCWLKVAVSTGEAAGRLTSRDFRFAAAVDALVIEVTAQ